MKKYMIILILGVFCAANLFAQEDMSLDSGEELLRLMTEESVSAGDDSAENLISLQLKDVSLRDVIRLFSKLSNANIIVPDFGEEVESKQIDVNLNQVSWKPALQAILETHGLELYEKISNTDVYSVRVRPPSADAPRKTRTFVFDYANIQEASAMISTVVGTEGQVISFPQGNAVVVKSTQEVIDDIAQIVEQIDVPRKQVLIEARIMELDNTDRNARGISFDWTKILTGAENSSTALNPLDGNLFFSSLAELSATDIIAGGGTLGTLTLNAADLGVTLEALQTSKRARLVSHPKVIVANGETAKIQILQKIPRIAIERTIEQTDSPTPTVTYSIEQDDDGEDPNTGRKRYAEYEFGIRLEVTPTIYTEENIAVNIVPIISRRDDDNNISIDLGENLKNTFYAVEEKRVETTFFLGNNRTAVIGGLTESREVETERKIPLLGDIPIIRHLFTHRRVDDIQTENIIFVTVSLEDGLDFDVDSALAESPLTRKQIIREESDREIENTDIELSKEHETTRIIEEIEKIERKNQAETRDRKLRKPLWKVLRPTHTHK